MKVRPLHDRLLVKRIEKMETTKGGLIIPDTAKEKPMEGKIIAAGKGKVDEDGNRRPLDVHKGDRCSSASTPAPRFSSRVTNT
jgi:chaperonin GroES